LADMAIGYVQDHKTERYLLTLAKIRTSQGRYLEAVTSLDSLIAKDPKHLEAWTLRGHAYFLNGNLFESEESYIRALRLKPGLKD
jgi:Flp pilus assembly protein TadD